MLSLVNYTLKVAFDLRQEKTISFIFINENKKKKGKFGFGQLGRKKKKENEKKKKENRGIIGQSMEREVKGEEKTKKRGIF